MSKFTRNFQHYYSCRWRLCYFCTIASLLMQTLRTDISMAFVCMLKTKNRTTEEVNITSTNQHCSGIDNRSTNQNYEGEFEWSDTLQANILAGFYFGYIATHCLGGLLADKYGAKRVVGGSILSASILTILHPSLSRISGYFTLILRILTGMASGLMYPAVHSLYGRWAPPQEIGSLTGLTFAGLNLGNIVCHTISGYLCVYGFDNGWGSIFYIFGGISFVFSCVWFYAVYDTPDVHPTISEKERSYLNRTIKSERVVKKVPWKRLISSPAVWAICFGRFAQTWTALSFQVLLPIYMTEALNVSTTSNGLMSSAPSAGPIIALPLFGFLADFIYSKKYMSTRSVRVLFQTIALIVSGGELVAIGFLGCDQTILISILLFLIGLTLSISSGGVVVNINDIAPSYAGIIFGIANTFAMTTGIISPLSAKALTPNGTQEEWQIVFFVCAAICVVGTIFYAILARGEIQDWAISEDSASSVPLNDMNTNKSSEIVD